MLIYVEVFLFIIVLFGIPSAHGDYFISPTIRETIGLWSQGRIGDEKFIGAIGSMINEGTIKIVTKENSGQVYYLPQYGQTSYVKITGTTGDFRKTNSVFLEVVRPDGKIIETRAFILDSGVYQTTLIINHEFPIGVYKIQGNYIGNKISESFFEVKQKTSHNFPSWFKNPSRWLSDNEISEKEFVQSLEYLIQNKIVEIDNISEKTNQHLQFQVDGISKVRRGTTQTISIMLKGNEGNISNAQVSASIEDYGNNVLKDFSCRTDENGQCIFSWEISKDWKTGPLFVFIDGTNGLATGSYIFSFEVVCLCGEENCSC